MGSQHSAGRRHVAGAACPRGSRATFLPRRGEHCSYLRLQFHRLAAVPDRERAWPRWLHESGYRATAAPPRLRRSYLQEGSQ